MAYCAYCGSHVAQVSLVPCASCGNPTNGAPPRPVIRKGAVSPVVGIVIGLVLLVPFLGILAAIAIPNFLTAMQRSKQKRTMADMRSIATALESYAADHNAYPKGESLADVQPQVVPKYLKALPAVDGWSHPFRYIPMESGYMLGSAGADGVFDQAPEGDKPVETRNFDCDIVFSNGNFLMYPEGH